MDKKRAAMVLGVLLFAFAFVSLAVTPQLGYFVGGGSNLSTWLGIGQTVGSALASAFGSSWFELIGIILFVA